MNKSGFTLLELLVVMVVIGLLATILMPNLRTPGYERKQFIGRLNALTRLGWQNALITNKVQRVQFDFAAHTVQLQSARDKSESSDELQFGPLKEIALNTSFTIPEQIEVRQFFIEGFDEMSRFSGRKTGEVWFYIVPDGMAQEVIINFFDTKDTIEGKVRPVSLVLNPFTVQFKEYDSFQK